MLLKVFIRGDDVNLPGIQSLSFKRNNIRSFIFDWFDTHSNFTKENSLELDGLNARYYYDDSSDIDVIEMHDGKTLSLDETSSGIQSSAPLYVYLKYLTEWIFENEPKISYEKEQRLQSALDIKYADIALSRIKNRKIDNVAEFYKDDTFRSIAKDLRKVIETMRQSDTPSDEMIDYLNNFIDLENALSHPHYTKIIIEEPEQNLFPETQGCLVKYIFNHVKVSRDNIVITTHSPSINETRPPSISIYAATSL